MYYAEWLEITTEEKYVVKSTEKFISLEDCLNVVKHVDKNPLDEIDFLEIDSHNNHIIILYSTLLASLISNITHILSSRRVFSLSHLYPSVYSFILFSLIHICSSTRVNPSLQVLSLSAS